MVTTLNDLELEAMGHSNLPLSSCLGAISNALMTDRITKLSEAARRFAAVEVDLWNAEIERVRSALQKRANITTKDGSELATGRWMNGNTWIRLDVDHKQTYLAGFEEGDALAVLLSGTMTPKPSIAEVRKLEDNFVPDGAFSLEDKVQQLDIFYRKAANRHVPIAWGYLYVIKKFRGTSVEELEAYESHIREITKDF